VRFHGKFVRIFQASLFSTIPKHWTDVEQEIEKRSEARNLRLAWKEGWEDGTPRVANGVKNRVNQLKCLGNAVVPQVAFVVGEAILEVEGEMNEVME
jgi:hypothetical protein